MTVMSLLLVEQIGGGFLALVLNVPYFGGMVIGGGIIARAVEQPDGLYWTMAVLNVSGMLVTPAIAWLYVRRMSDPAPPAGEQPAQPPTEPATAPAGTARPIEVHP